ncbi:hypothetical protein [Flavobacterium filum]|uniref:hypothetical protein n=1 Tax=Flavobacterium filum TaxID=370974 RepID=UPI0023F31058|nr:hypothetical protein [Flavobacterium filum]
MLIENLKKSKEDLYNQIEELETELEDYREEDDEAEELGHDSDPLEQGAILKDGGEIDTYIMPPEDKGLELYEKKTQELLKLIDGGNISLNEIEALNQAKKGLGGGLNSLPEMKESEKTVNDIKNELKKGNGKVHESVLAQFKNIQYFDTNTALKKLKVIGNDTFILKRNFLQPTYSIYKK